MKKLKKNFLDKKSTVEAMTDSCLGNCSCSTMSCRACGSSSTQYTKVFNNENNTRKNTFRIAAW